MTKCVISGYIGFDNFGDEAIQRVLTDQLRKNGATKITLISSNPKKTAELYDVNSCSMLGFFKDLWEADFLYSGGGSLLQDVTSLKSLIYYLGVIYTALFFRKKVIIYAQGIGPINSKIGQILTKFALKHAIGITVRDKKSQELLKSWGIDSKLVSDPVFELELPVKNKKRTVGVQLRSFQGLTERFLDGLADEIIKHFSDKTIRILSLQDSIDLEVCEKFNSILKNKNPDLKTEILKELTVNEVFDEISELEYLIAMRFHANVVAIKSKVKTLAINYDVKVEKLAEEYNLPIIELNQTDFSNEFEKLLIF